MQALAADTGLKVGVHDEATCRQRLRTSKSDLISVPRPDKRLAASTCSMRPAPRACWPATRPTGLFCAPRTRKHQRSGNGGRRTRQPVHRLPHSRPARHEPAGRRVVRGRFRVADMRVRKLLKRFQATPMRRSDFLLSLMISRLIFTFVDIALLLGFAYLVFDIRVRGNMLAFLMLIPAGGVAFAGLGLLLREAGPGRWKPPPVYQAR